MCVLMCVKLKLKFILKESKMSNQLFERISTSIFNLDRSELSVGIRGFIFPQSGARLDFDKDYLDNATLDQLRHILMGAISTSLDN